MSKTPSERQTGIKKRAAAQVGSVEANSRTPGSRSLQAGGEFVKALGGDLAAVASQLRRSLIAKHRRTPPPRASAPSRPPQRPTIGRMLGRLCVAVLLALGTIFAGGLSAVTLWVLFSSPVEPRRSNADALGFEARTGESPGRLGPLRVGDASRQDLAREAGAQGWPGSSSADAAEQKAAKETQTDAGAGADQPQLVPTEPQDRRPAAGQQESSRSLTDSRPPMQCNIDRCAATYTSFHAADCTYQPHGGGPRRSCELNTRSADAQPQTSRAATDPRSEAKDTRVAERAAAVPESTTPDRDEAQCNVDRCAATYTSFHAADCTYQPRSGGPRRICEQ